MVEVAVEPRLHNHATNPAKTPKSTAITRPWTHPCNHAVAATYTASSSTTATHSKRMTKQPTELHPVMLARHPPGGRPCAGAAHRAGDSDGTPAHRRQPSR